MHPDKVHDGTGQEREEAGRRCADLNAAYQCLRSPQARLQHLLTLESGGKPSGIEQAPVETMELFAQVGQLARDVDAFLAERGKVTSPLLRVQWFEKGIDWTEKVNGLLEVLRPRQAELDSRLRALNVAWETAPPVGHPARARTLPLAELEELYRAHSYLARWIAQLQERNAQLTIF